MWWWFFWFLSTHVWLMFDWNGTMAGFHLLDPPLTANAFYSSVGITKVRPTCLITFLKLLDRTLLYLFRRWSVITSFLMTSRLRHFSLENKTTAYRYQNSLNTSKKDPFPLQWYRVGPQDTVILRIRLRNRRNVAYLVCQAPAFSRLHVTLQFKLVAR